MLLTILWLVLLLLLCSPIQSWCYEAEPASQSCLARCSNCIAAAPPTEQPAACVATVHLDANCNAKCAKAAVTHAVLVPTSAGTIGNNAADLSSLAPSGVQNCSKICSKKVTVTREVELSQGRMSLWWQWGPARPLGRTTPPLAGSSSSRSPGSRAAAPKKRRNGTPKWSMLGQLLAARVPAS